jgi:hypothetical protein
LRRHIDNILDTGCQLRKAQNDPILIFVPVFAQSYLIARARRFLWFELDDEIVVGIFEKF